MAHAASKGVLSALKDQMLYAQNTVTAFVRRRTVTASQKALTDYVRVTSTAYAHRRIATTLHKVLEGYAESTEAPTRTTTRIDVAT